MPDDLLTELQNWQSAGKRVTVWWRDDDAVQPTAALKQLAGLADLYSMPMLIAVIPAHVEDDLAHLINSDPRLEAAVHGFAHANHALPGAKKTELICRLPERRIDAVLDELVRAQKRIRTLFGDESARILVPPWNRIAPEIAEKLPETGFSLLSGFTFDRQDADIAQLNCHIDLMCWKPERRGKEIAEINRELVDVLVTARQNDFAPIGILSHHLVHDQNAWASAEHLMKLFHENGIFNRLSARSIIADNASYMSS